MRTKISTLGDKKKIDAGVRIKSDEINRTVTLLVTQNLKVIQVFLSIIQFTYH